MNKPNILLFVTDQQRGDTVPPYSRAKLPNIEALAQEGVTFSQAFCTAPHCCPSRASLHSGLYPSQHGVWNNVSREASLSPGLYENTRLWSEDLKDAGYILDFYGKWHISSIENPENRGWRMHPPSETEPEGLRHRRISGRSWENFQRKRPLPGIARGGHIQRPGYPEYFLYGEVENRDADLHKVEEVIETIRNYDSDQPWCQCINVSGPHDPYFVPAEYLDLYPLEEIQLPASFSDKMQDKPALYRIDRERFDQLSGLEQRKALQHYLALCSYEDALFGKIVAALKEQGKWDNTIVIYLSDHGDYAAEHGLWTKGLACFRGAYHVPLIIRWPQEMKNPGRVVDELVSLTDISPTLLDFAQTTSPQKPAGRSLLPFLKNETITNWRDAIFTQSNGNEIYGIQRSVMTKDWKFVYNTFDYDELYDLQQDPGETQNLAQKEQYQEIVREMYRKIWQFAYEHDDDPGTSYIFTGLATYGAGILFEE